MTDAIVTQANTVYRDYLVDGVSSSGPNNILKSDIRNLWAALASILDGIAGTGGTNGYVGFTTLAGLDADLNYNAGTVGEVLADPTPANNGTYLKSGASGTGSWTQVSTLTLAGLTAALTTETANRIAGDTSLQNSLETAQANIAALTTASATVNGEITSINTSITNLTPLVTEDGIGLGDLQGFDGLRATSLGPEIGGIRFTDGEDGPITLADRFGFTNGGSGDFTRDEVRQHDAEAVAYSAMVRAQFDSVSQRPTCNYNVILSDGQSLSEGTQPDTTNPIALSTTARFGSLMLGAAPFSATEANTTFDVVGGSSSFDPLVSVAGLAGQNSQGYRGEIPVVSAVNTFKQAWLQSQAVAADTSRLMVGVGCGVGGITVFGLSSGGSPNYYGKVTSAISQLASIAAGASKTICCPAIIWIQGEQDYLAETSQTNYASRQAGLMGSIQAAVEGSFSQPYPPAVFTYQTSGLFEGSDPLGADGQHLPVSMAQYANSQSLAGWYMIGPSYPYPNGASGHLTSNGYRWMGNKFGQCMHEVLARGRKWNPLSPYKIMSRGSTVLITFSVPAPPIQFASVYVGTVATLFQQLGFEVYDDQGSLGFVGVKIFGQATVVILCTRQLSTNVRVRYGGYTVHGGAGNLCDSDPFVAPDSYVYEAATNVASSTVHTGGSGGTNGAVTLTVVGGTGTSATLTGTITGGAFTGALTVASAGNYTAFPSTPASVTGGGLTGATVNLVSAGMNANENIAALVGNPYPMNNWSIVFDLPSL